MANYQYPTSYVQGEVPIWLSFSTVPYSGLAVLRGISSYEKAPGWMSDTISVNMPKEYVVSDGGRYSMGDTLLFSTGAAPATMNLAAATARMLKIQLGQEAKRVAGKIASAVTGFQFPEGTDTIFKGANIRKFHFNLDFFPKTYKEAEEVTKIIHAFRKNVYPVSFGSLSVMIGALHPPLWVIKVVDTKGKTLEDWDMGLQLSILAQCVVDKEPFGPRAITNKTKENFAPSATKVTLVFFELEPNYYVPGNDRIASRSAVLMEKDIIKSLGLGS